MRRLEVALARLNVDLNRSRPPTDAERWNGLARRYMLDAAYQREVDNRGRGDLGEAMQRCGDAVVQLRAALSNMRETGDV